MKVMITSLPTYDAYKDSEIDWLGKIPKDWEVCKLGACLQSVSEKNHGELQLLSITREQGVIKRDVDDETNHNFIPDDLSNYKLIKKGQFGINKMKAWQGSYGVSNYTGIVSPAYYVFSFKKIINTYFFNIAIRSNLYISSFIAASDGVRVGQWDLSKARMKVIPILLPPLKDQAAIVNFLDKKKDQIDKAIAIKEQQIARLKEYQQIIIQKAVTQGLNPNMAMKETVLGKIPNHWSCTKFKFSMTIKARLGWKGLKSYEYLEKSDYGFLSTPNIKDKNIRYEDAYFISRFRYEESPEIMLKQGDVLLVKDGSTLGISNIVKKLPFKCTVNSSIAVLRIVNNNIILSEYFNYFLKSESMQKTIREMKDGMGVPHLFQADIKNFTHPTPPITEQKEIVNYIEAESHKIEKAIELKQLQIEKLKEYKTTLINSAVTGKIKVV